MLMGEACFIKDVSFDNDQRQSKVLGLQEREKERERKRERDLCSLDAGFWYLLWKPGKK